MSYRRFCVIALIILTNSIAVLSQLSPNLIVILTDEHNLRTLGCYRDTMRSKQGYVWGKDVNVDTPYIDSLANNGALYTNFYSVAPLCTPSRASFMTGRYPYETGAWKNHLAMNSDEVTWARILQMKNYKTGYIGKWHLNGDAKPDFSNKDRKFGFDSTKYMFNRGHWKLFDEDSGTVGAYDWVDRGEVRDKLDKAYATDFMFDKGIEFIKPKIRNGTPFALMMSIPDPHGPNDVRPPYDTMFNDKTFKLPETAVAAYKKQPAPPGWSAIHTDLENADQIMEDIVNKEEWQNKHRNYLGMVKLIDDNVGKLLKYLETTGQADNTVIVFTSDHGDMMAEHAKYNKGKPYKTSAGIPMIIKYPNAIRPGKLVRTSYTSPDFAPTILSLMGIDYSQWRMSGIDGSYELLNDNRVNKQQQVRFITDSKQAKWVAAIDRDMKLVVASGDVPWLFDQTADPDELKNYYNSDYSYHVESKNRLRKELFDGITRHNFPVQDAATMFFDHPFCDDPPDVIPSLPFKLCSDLKQRNMKQNCDIKAVAEFCPNACGKCCEDSSGEIWHNQELITCPYVRTNQKFKRCRLEQIRTFCPVTCGKCIPEPSSEPSSKPSVSYGPTAHPSKRPSSSPSDIPSESPSNSPTHFPSLLPSDNPSVRPSTSPSEAPSYQPTDQPTRDPSDEPSDIPSNAPSPSPSDIPTNQPTSSPTETPSQTPTDSPSLKPTAIPTDQPSSSPSAIPTANPSSIPSKHPSSRPSHKPTSNPSNRPSKIPTEIPTAKPSAHPSSSPSNKPTANPSSIPSNHPSSRPSHKPTSNPSNMPSKIPTEIPTIKPSAHPSSSPSNKPTAKPTLNPSMVPTEIPSTVPSETPSSNPSAHPSLSPSTIPTLTPSNVPSAQPSDDPSSGPTTKPSLIPSDAPSLYQSNDPSTIPTLTPTSIPSGEPSVHPSNIPTSSDEPSAHPIGNPSSNPSIVPSLNLSHKPSSSLYPTSYPSDKPSLFPSDDPSNRPTSDWMVNFQFRRGLSQNEKNDYNNKQSLIDGQ